MGEVARASSLLLALSGCIDLGGVAPGGARDGAAGDAPRGADMGEGEAEGEADAGACDDGTDPAWPDDEPLPEAFDLPPYLTLSDATTVVVSWRGAGEAEGVVRFGRAGGALDGEIDSPPALLHHVPLAGLCPGGAYAYEVETGGAVRRGVFVVPGGGRAAWRFAAIAEFHAPSWSAWAALFAAPLREFRPHLLVESGDMVDYGGDGATWREYLRASAPWISNVPILPAHSNHANGDGGNALLADLFVLPGNERWYATRAGAIEFLTIDSTYAYPEIASDEPPWIAERALAAHDGDDDPALLVAAWHYPACSSSYASRAATHAWVRDNLVAALVAGGGADLILVGHDRYYERSTLVTEAGEVVQVQTASGKLGAGAAGGDLPECAPQVTRGDLRTILLADVDGGTISARAVTADGVEVDAFEIAR